MRSNTPRTSRLAALVASFAATGCAGDKTTGERVALATRVEAPGATSAIATQGGHTVTLERALVATGALTYFDGSPAFASSSPTRSIDRGHREHLRRRGVLELFELLPIRAAHAHPGHYAPGTARGEMTTPSSVDLIGAPIALAEGNGIAGPVRSGTFRFHVPAEGPHAVELGTYAAIFEGRAEKDGAARRFRAAIEASELATAGSPSIEGCAFARTEGADDALTNGATVTVSLEVAKWFETCDLAELDAAAADAITTLSKDGVAHRALVRGMKSAATYVFSVAPR